jgi:hypothetical protein
VDRRRVALIAVLAIALLIAGIALGSTGVRLATAPTAVPTPEASTTPAAFDVFARKQTAAERADAAFVRGPDLGDLSAVRLLGQPEALVVLGWRAQGDVCLGAYRPGSAPQPSIECAHEQDFADGGVSIRWPDSPDLGPFDITWQPDGALIVQSATAPSAPEPTSTPGRLDGGD